MAEGFSGLQLGSQMKGIARDLRCSVLGKNAAS